MLTLEAPGSEGYFGECIGRLGERFIQDIKRDPSSYYVNVHAAEFQSGAVRGQLSKIVGQLIG